MLSSRGCEGPLLLCIAGPTGAGKTHLAIELYLRWGWPILSADARQVYRYLDIGTNKVPQAVQARVPHFLIDIRWPDEAYSAGAFVQDVEALLHAWKGLPVVQVVGGTGFYFQALLYGLAPLPPVEPTLRQAIQRWYEAEGLLALVAWLQERDPFTAARIDLCNPRRVMRAIEVLQATGRPWASFWEGPIARKRWAWVVVLSLPRETLYRAIGQRTRAQVAAGWLEETRFLLEKGYRPDDPALQTLGYRECLEVIEGRRAFASLTEAIAQANRHYARRQLTWWRHHPHDMWLEGLSLSEQRIQIERAVFQVLDK